MSFLEKALKLAESGFHVFPLISNSKNPLIKDFPNKATRDRKTIEDWWIDPVLEFERDYNIGISTTRFGDDEALIVVDVDNKKGKKGSDTLLELEFEGKELPQTFTQTTPTGGYHFVFRHPVAVKQGSDVLGHGLDIRSKGGYIVAWGSVLDGQEYTVIMNPLKDAPQWLVESCGKAPEKKAVIEAEFTVNQENAIERALEYLANHAPIAEEGNSGDQTTFRVAAKLKDFGVKQQNCLELLLDHWNNECSPPWSVEELEKKVENAYSYGNEPVGVSAPEAQFTPVVAEEAEVHYLHKINQDHALVLVEGTYFIIHETTDEKGKPKLNFLNEVAFKRKFSPFTVQKNQTYAQQWLDWKNRREYAGICFAPEREVSHNYYNLWRGFTVTPLPYEEANASQKEGFDMFMAHAKENVAQGNEALFNWIIGYFAHMVQKPYERPLTTVVFRGRKGVGKNALVDRVGKLIGKHYLVAHNKRYLTSNFNGHMDSCLCLVLDEAFWSGDKDAEGQLKGLTTGPEILIERKGKEPYTVDNLVRLIIIGNDDWLVPASNDERRYAVYDVGEGKKQNRGYFHKMRVLMDDEGGNRILLHFLKNFDLSSVDVNDAPKTQGLLDQKVSSLDPFEEWWYGSLLEGRILNSDFASEWQTEVNKDGLRAAFYRYCKDRSIRSRLPDERAIGKMLKKYCPDMKPVQIRDSDSKCWVYRIPDLRGCRGHWEKHVGQEVNWEQ